MRRSFSKIYVRKTGKRPKTSQDPYTTPQHSPESSSLQSKDECLQKGIFSKRKNKNSIDNCDPLSGQVTNVGSPIDARTPDIPPTKIQNRLRNKTRKVKMYWDRVSLMIPNVFKMNVIYREEREVIEFNDLSLKGILVMNPLYKNNTDQCNEGADSQDLFSDEMDAYGKEGRHLHVDFPDLDFLI